MDANAMHDLLRFKQGQTAPEPMIHTEKPRRGKLHCNCGDSFGPHEFNRWQAHVRVCPTIRQED